MKRPVLTNGELEKIRSIDMPGLKAKTIRTLFTSDENDGALARAVQRICDEAYDAVQEGNTIIILSDRGVDVYDAPIPSLLAVAGVHHHLIRQGVRTKVSLIVESGEPREVAHLALLIGYGAVAVNPYLAFETIRDMVGEDGDLAGVVDYETARIQLCEGGR